MFSAFKLNQKEKAILAAAGEGNEGRVREILMTDQPLINTRNPNGQSPLHLAAAGGHQEIVALLLDRGANVNDMEKCKLPILSILNKKTPMKMAAAAGKREVVEMLLKQGGEMDAVKAMLEACHDNDVRRVERVLKGNPELLTIVDSTGKTPLHLAAKNGFTEIVRMLLKNGAKADQPEMDPNPIVRRYFGRTPLEYAVTEGHNEVAYALIAGGANVNIKHTTGKTPLHMAAINANFELIELLVKKGADLNARDSDGKTPLHLMVFDGREREAEFLIQHKADVNVQDSLGLTPLHIAIMENQHKLARILIYKGANVKLEDRLGCTPVFMATEQTPLEIVELMAARGMDLNHTNKDGFNAISTIQNEKIIQYLRNKGAK
jgi:ankyrin repeat protein